MPTLEVAQGNFVDTINDGPAALDPALFDGPADRVLLGLKAHANTINHARLVALEDTFPRVRAHVGGDAFNALCRDYVETETARASDSNSIGAGFPDFLSAPPLAELARIEWAWLQSYHAAEATPLLLADLGAMNEAELLTTGVAAHPSARLVEVSSPLLLEELAGQHPPALLCVRPDAEVRIVPLDAIPLAVFRAAQKENAVLGNLLGAAIELSEETAPPLAPVMDLIGAGALVATG